MPSCKTFRKQEFRCTNWGCKFDENPAAFGRPRWRGCHEVIFLILHRLVWALLYLCLLLAQIIQGKLDAYQFRFLSNQNFLLFTFSLILSFFVTLFTITGHLGKKWNHFLGFHWVIHNAAVFGTSIVTIVYWAILYPPRAKAGVADLDFKAIAIHGINLIYFYLDIWIGKVPVRFYHFYHGIVFVAYYLIFTFILIEAGGTRGRTYIYSVLDFYTNPGSATLYTFGIVVMGMALWSVYYGLHVLASYVEHKRNERVVGPFWDEENEEPTQEKDPTESVQV